MKCEDVGCPCVDQKPAAESEWLDKPDGDGWWWRVSYDSKNMLPIWVGNGWAQLPDGLKAVKKVDGKWQRIKMPTPPPAPLPRERQVTLTAKVFIDDPESRFLWCLEVFFLRDGYHKTADRQKFETKQAAIKWVRDTYGLEPTVVEGEE